MSIARSGKLTSPVSITENLLHLLPSGSNKRLRILRRIVASKSKQRFQSLCILELKTSFGNILGNLCLTRRSLFCKLSSLLPASNPGCRLLNSDIHDRHAGWNNPTLKNRHVKYPVNHLLQVSKSLGL